MEQSARLVGVQNPVIPIVGRMIREHPGTISLGQGVVHYGPPERALERVRRALDEGVEHKYGAVEGVGELVERIRVKLAGDNAVVVGEDRRVVVTAGANLGFMNALLSIADVGDEVILLGPYYFNHEMAITMAGCRAVVVETDADYQPDVSAIAAAVTEKTAAVVTVSPNNPTGAVYCEESLRAINRLCRERGVYHVCDEPYEYFTYGGLKHFSPASIEGGEGHTIGLYSLSKAYGFASWRIGYMVIPEHLEVAVKKVQDTLLICPPVLNQYAAVGAMDAGLDWCREKVAGIADVREMVIERLSGLRCVRGGVVSDGAFYVLLRLDTEMKDMALVEGLVNEHGVAVLPGGTFGIESGTAVRVAYGALEQATVEQGIGRLIRGLERLL